MYNLFHVHLWFLTQFLYCNFFLVLLSISETLRAHRKMFIFSTEHYWCKEKGTSTERSGGVVMFYLKYSYELNSWIFLKIDKNHNPPPPFFFYPCERNLSSKFSNLFLSVGDLRRYKNVFWIRSFYSCNLFPSLHNIDPGVLPETIYIYFFK